MKEISTWAVGKQYLQGHSKGILLYCIFAGVFALVFYLYHLPVEAVLYAVLLCVVLVLPVLTVDFHRHYQRYRVLRDLQKQITFSLEGLPEPKGLLEQEYQELIAAVYRDKIGLVSQADNERSDLVDYYTLWAHQIKTPIAAMGLLLQSSPSAEDDRSTAQSMEHNSELAMELFKIEQYVEMVLQYLRLESPSSDFVLKRYSLDVLVRQAVHKYAKMFIRRKISLDFSELNCDVLTDEKWLLFVIEQILSNALKYTREGKISIYMERGSAKTLVIADTGIGIAGEDLPRVFEKGFTGYNGRRHKKSTGIGLYLCKRILTKLSHTIVIEAESGKGTKVKLGLDTVDMVME
ncbi:sensor histidine kinase [Desulforamulus aeronauticus]|uniref:histidine kinase n=1 Tax=Desulforamulus aeronauticus DSM 10349 TaxID=1121421 RepID=A0A1M6Q3P1_9FIRM|nr:sensor histidine kinase [Desulforamulus aeronauticus]SHK14746.1 Signal transduction histidine kinase [Desulforamulus aeronauticus DSM 10349]